MTTQREYESVIWEGLYGHLRASTWDELLGMHPEDVDALSNAESRRVHAAIERVSALTHKHTTPRRNS